VTRDSVALQALSYARITCWHLLSSLVQLVLTAVTDAWQSGHQWLVLLTCPTDYICAKRAPCACDRLPVIRLPAALVPVNCLQHV
jgi:hypothetical protein